MITFILLVLTTISFTTGYTDVKVVIKPEALNINPGVLTCYVKFPDFFGVPVTLDATLDGGALDKWMIDYDGLPAEQSGVPTNVGEEGLTAPIVIMKFRRQDIVQALSEKGDILDTEFILNGTFDDGTAPADQPYSFEGSDSITKIVNEETETTTGSSGKGGSKK